MTAADRLRAAALPALAVLLVGGVLGVQLDNGGGDYQPLRPADPCVARPVTSVSTGIDGLTERLVLIGLDNAGCQLGLSREALTLQLAESRTPTDAQLAALKAGLLAAVDRLKAEGMLPRPSQLAGEAVKDSGLNGFVKLAIRALPDSVIDGTLSTDDVLRRTIDNLDLRTLFAHLDNSGDLTTQVNAAVRKAVIDAVVARLRSLV